MVEAVGVVEVEAVRVVKVKAVRVVDVESKMVDPYGSYSTRDLTEKLDVYNFSKNVF